MYQYGNVAYKYQNEKRYKRPLQNKKKSEENNSHIQIRPNAAFYSRGKLLVIFAVIIVLAVLSLLMARAAILTEKNYEYLALEEQLQHLEKTNEQLETEIVQLRSPERILKLAENELGMAMKANSVKILSHSKTDQP